MKVALDIIVILLICAGCSSNNDNLNSPVIDKNSDSNSYIFRAENEQWTLEYKVEIVTSKDSTENKTGANRTLTVTYKNDISKSSVENLEISYDSGVSGGKMTETYDNGSLPTNTFKLTSSSASCAIENEDQAVTATIVTDGNKQTFELKKVS